jgi:SsrA-binding protein
MSFSENRKARHDYEILSTYDAGIVLSGGEVKSVREGHANLTGSYLAFRGGELWVLGLKIPRYSKAGSRAAYDDARTRKVLMHKRELASLFGKIEQKGLTLVPISLYAHGRHVKLRFGLGRGKKAHDKRETLKRRDIDRELRRES